MHPTQSGTCSLHVVCTKTSSIGCLLNFHAVEAILNKSSSIHLTPFWLVHLCECRALNVSFLTASMWGHTGKRLIFLCRSFYIFHSLRNTPPVHQREITVQRMVCGWGRGCIIGFASSPKIGCPAADAAGTVWGILGGGSTGCFQFGSVRYVCPGRAGLCPAGLVGARRLGRGPVGFRLVTD